MSYDFNWRFSKLYNKTPHGSKLTNLEALSIYIKAFDPKMGYELKNRCSRSLTKAQKTILTIEKNRKSIGMTTKRDNLRVPQNSNNPQNKQENSYRNEIPRLHEMSYNTNWKDGKPIIDRPKYKKNS